MLIWKELIYEGFQSPYGEGGLLNLADANLFHADLVSITLW